MTRAASSVCLSLSWRADCHDQTRKSGTRKMAICFTPSERLNSRSEIQAVLAKQTQRRDHQKDRDEIDVRDLRHVQRPAAEQPERGGKAGCQQTAAWVDQEVERRGDRQVEGEKDHPPEGDPGFVVAQTGRLRQRGEPIEPREIGRVLVIFAHVAREDPCVGILAVEKATTLHPRIVDVLALRVSIPELYVRDRAGRQNDQEARNDDGRMLWFVHAKMPGRRRQTFCTLTK